MELIRQGCAPSERPRGVRAVLVNDTLWSTLTSCWLEQNWRPTSRMFLEALDRMLQNGEVSTSPVLIDLFPTSMDEPLAPWPEEIQDLKGLIAIGRENSMLTSSLRSKVWMCVNLFLSAGR
jgi:hypothetical protein